jgi:hypothetical protein
MLEGTMPAQAMDEAADWVRSVSEDHRPVLVAYPVAFDWSFLHWYFERFASGGSPFGHSSCLDIRTLYQVIAGAAFDRSGKSAMPDSLRPVEPHTHNALDDAVRAGRALREPDGPRGATPLQSCTGHRRRRWRAVVSRTARTPHRVNPTHNPAIFGPKPEHRWRAADTRAAAASERSTRTTRSVDCETTPSHASRATG